MTLPVPLTVRVGDQHVTRQVQALSFRREAIGGVRSIALTLDRSLSDLDGVDPLAKVYVYDGRNAQTVADGRLSDTGRTASDGQRWECVAFGPAQATSNWSGPLIYIDQDLGAWRQVAASNAEFSFATSSRPDAAVGPNGLMGLMREGVTLASGDFVTLRYDRIHNAGQKLAGFFYLHFHGISSSSVKLDAVTANVDAAGGYTAIDTPASEGFSTTQVGTTRSVSVDFTDGRDVLDLRVLYNDAGGPNGPDVWAFLPTMMVRAVTFTKAGSEILGVTYGTAGNLLEPYPHEVVADLLGRPGLLDEFDGAKAVVDSSFSTRMDQLAYPDGITPAQVLDDLMRFAPAYRWYGTPDTTGSGYGFHWEPWPTAVRYEATLDDGGSFPLSTQALYNEVAVRWQDPTAGVTRTTVRTMACTILDNAGITRRATIDLGSEAGSEAQAIAAGDAFLDEHNVPKNGGTLTVARPIRDVISGSLVQPWEIEPGELVRVLGVEAYPDAFNALSNDGQGVFRIFAVDYTTEGNVATLALDSDPRETEDALVKLLNERTRR